MNISRLIGGIIVGLAFSGSGNAQEGRAVLYSPSMASEAEIIANGKIDDSVLSFDNLEFDENGELLPSTAKAQSSPAQTSDKKENTPAPAPKIQGIIPPPSPIKGGENPDFTEAEVSVEKIEEGTSLTDALKNKEDEIPQENASKEEESWISKLKQPLSAIGSSIVSGEGAKSTLENLMTDSQVNKERSNASVFDISGIMLRMSPLQVDDAMKKRGFQKVNQEYEIPNFIRWRNEEACRNNGVVGYERLESCVVEMAKKNNYQYIYLTKYVKYKTKEEITVRYTSNFTNNKVYQVIYKSMAATLTSSGAKAIYLRNIKVYDFWKLINRKYGAPDNKEEVTWGLGNNKPFMRASTGFLHLEDPMLRELDYTRMSREDQLFMNTNLYSF